MHTEDVDPEHALEVLWCELEEWLYLCYACVGDPENVSIAYLLGSGRGGIPTSCSGDLAPSRWSVSSARLVADPTRQRWRRMTFGPWT